MDEASSMSVSVIIPSHLGIRSSGRVLKALLRQTAPPKEVILVLSGIDDEEDSWYSNLQVCFERSGIRLKYVQISERLNPGASRNVGLRFAKYDWVAFLDIETIPPSDWLERQFALIRTLDAQGAFGATEYFAVSFKNTVIRDAIYGRKPLRTIPGAVLKKEIFNIVGQFIPCVRAAEDTEWIIRARAIRVAIVDGEFGSPIVYYGLGNLSFRGLLKKWRRNYLSARQLQHLKLQSIFIWLLTYFVSSLVAFNWNAIVAGWSLDSPFYIGHVAKIASLTPPALYVFFRGFYIPYRRGVPLISLLPFRFLLLAAIGAVLDFVKVGTILVFRAVSDRKNSR